MEISLNHLRPGMEAQVMSVRGCDHTTARLRSFGLRRGVRLRCCERSPNGQVTALLVENRCIRLQTRDLEKILVLI
jgi:Fe2+ transport system protein FeoA